MKCRLAPTDLVLWFAYGLTLRGRDGQDADRASGEHEFL
nr:hypothetical protein [uncultured bacterium]